MRIIAIGDVVSRPGCEYLRQMLPKLKKEFNADAVIVNGENSAVGNGITPQSADYIFDSGADAITLGNHSLRRREIYNYLDDETKPIVRPANYHNDAPGRRYIVIDKGNIQFAVVNLQGAVFLESYINPFSIIDEIIDEITAKGIKLIFVDIHAEATSEKKALGWYLDGRVSAVFGTHTHIQTSDNQILPQGTAYITDIGMTGTYYSVLGIDPECIIKKLKTGMPVKFENNDGPCIIEGCLFEIDEKTGRAISTSLIRR